MTVEGCNFVDVKLTSCTVASINDGSSRQQNDANGKASIVLSSEGGRGEREKIQRVVQVLAL